MARHQHDRDVVDVEPNVDQRRQSGHCAGRAAGHSVADARLGIVAWETSSFSNSLTTVRIHVGNVEQPWRRSSRRVLPCFGSARTITPTLVSASLTASAVQEKRGRNGPTPFRDCVAVRNYWQFTVVVTGAPPGVGQYEAVHEVARKLTDSVGTSLEPDSWTDVIEARDSTSLKTSVSTPLIGWAKVRVAVLKSTPNSVF